MLSLFDELHPTPRYALFERPYTNDSTKHINNTTLARGVIHLVGTGSQAEGAASLTVHQAEDIQLVQRVGLGSSGSYPEQLLDRRSLH